MNMLFVGAPNESLALESKNYDQDAVLVLPENLNLIDQIQTGYISIGDHQLNDFFIVLSKATEITYVPTSDWEHNTTKEQTERWLRYFSHLKPVRNIELITNHKFLTLKDTRKTENKQCWIVGEDIAAGIGLELNERFGEIISKNLNCEVSYLVDLGVSIDWCSDQILRSDIRENDIVVWMLPNVKNMTYFDSQLQKSIELSYRQNHRLDARDVNAKDMQIATLLQTAVSAIQKVISTSKIINYKLIISVPPVNDSDVELGLLDYLVNQKEFVHIYGQSDNYIDLNFDGTGEKPGPQQHQLYADIFLSKI